MPPTTPSDPDNATVRHLLSQALDLHDADALTAWQQQLQPVHLAGGQTLMAQGDPGDALYLLVSGRLRAYVQPAQGPARPVREMTRGAVVGEISLFNGSPRTATVVAIRDSTLMRLDRAHFAELVASQPSASMALARQIIERLQTEHLPSPLPAPVTLALWPLSADVDVAGFARGLAQALARHGRVQVLTSASDDISDAETAHDFVLLVADGASEPTHADHTAWAATCLRQADEVLLLAQAAGDPTAVPASSAFAASAADLLAAHAAGEAARTLVLLHDAAVRCPAGTAAWLSRYPVDDHVHLRPALPRDMARLARLISRTAVGLVLAGGGARGFAHLGVLRALHEHGIEVDCVGGTSIGAVMAMLAASDQSPDAVTAVARSAFSRNPTGDVNWLPLVSLLKGRRLRRVIGDAIQGLFDRSIDVEDLWKNCFCVASNYSQAREDVLQRGSLLKALLASVAIPGALPPVVHDGDLMCDGGTFNNFPVDVMRRRRGVGTVIGVDLGAGSPRRVDFDEVPGTWALLRDRLRPRRHQRYRLPSLPAYLLNVSVLYSQSRRAASQRLADVCFNPPLHRVGLLQWSRLDDVARQGHRHALEVLAQPAVSARLGLSGAGEHADTAKGAPTTSLPDAPGSAPQRTQSQPTEST